MSTDENKQMIDALAREVLILSRNTLLVNLRFLDAALSQFEYHPHYNSTLQTDGKYLLYNPYHILKCYKLEKEIPVRDYLHIVLHCIYRHMFIEPSINRPLWDLACDIAVENSITQLRMKTTSARRESQQSSYMESLKKEINFMTAEKVYRYLLDASLSPMDAENLRGFFYADDHDIWYMRNSEIERMLGGSLDLDSENSQESSAYEEIYGLNSSRTEIAQMWIDIAERIQQDLETFSRLQGDKAGSLVQNLTAVNREKYNYETFLKKFAVRGEVMKINDDEFDYIYYTYGLKLYKKMPLIEPLEYKEVKRIREFVIAIDTSGSVAGELVQSFVRKTYNILKSTESFFSRINLHIFQCDAAIQEGVKITTQEEFEAYLKTMRIKGLGGTDFRPIFSHVGEMIRNKEFNNLKGLIYFTDGYGTFPAHKPDYDTAFVFIDDEYNNPYVPPWAIRLVLQKDEI